MATATATSVLDLREAAWTSRSSLGADGADYFLVLCCRENREVYEPQFSQSGAPCVFASSVEEALRYGFMLPPLAIVIDVYTATRIGTEKVTGLFNLGVAWPVMRANLDQNDVRIVCLEPAKSQSLGTAVDELLQGDESWKHPRFFRKSMRIEMRVRARVRENVNQPWRNANLLSISVGGAYLVLGGDAIPAKGALAEIEVLDLGPKSLSARGHIAWRRTWNDGPDLPGVGIEFDPKTVTTELRTLVAQTIAPSVRTGNRQSLRESGPTADSIFASIETREAAREFNW